MSLLQIEALTAHYGDFQALFGVDLALEAGETVAIIGANGAGKTTLMRAVTGVARVTSGRVSLDGQDLTRLPAPQILTRGIAMVPEGRRLFPSLSVEENLVLGGHVARPGPWSLQKVYEVFPILKEKRHLPGPALSGGQQQMVAIGRALMANPDLLLLDELSLGLAPVVIKDIYAMLPRILSEGLATILVEQDVTRALRVSDRCLCMLEGRVSLAGPSADFTQGQIAAAYFGT